MKTNLRTRILWAATFTALAANLALLIGPSLVGTILDPAAAQAAGESAAEGAMTDAAHLAMTNAAAWTEGGQAAATSPDAGLGDADGTCSALPAWPTTSDSPAAADGIAVSESASTKGVETSSAPAPTIDDPVEGVAAAAAPVAGPGAAGDRATAVNGSQKGMDAGVSESPKEASGSSAGASVKGRAGRGRESAGTRSRVSTSEKTAKAKPEPGASAARQEPSEALEDEPSDESGEASSGAETEGAVSGSEPAEAGAAPDLLKTTESAAREASDKAFRRIVVAYESMEPQHAAATLSRLSARDVGSAVRTLLAMNPRKAGAVLDVMSAKAPETAAMLTAEMIAETSPAALIPAE